VNENCKVPLPTKFNCWKHHALFIKNEIELIDSEDQLAQLNGAMLKIGESQMDLYHGYLSPKEIANQTINFLASNFLKTKSKYLTWLRKDKDDYQSIILNDKSVWTLRLGDEEKRFVHIHPGRYSPHTVRVKALTLKTAVCVLVHSKLKHHSEFNVDFINEVRIKYLNASPIKSVNRGAGLGKLLNLFNSLA
jgi:hypothetical protein